MRINRVKEAKRKGDQRRRATQTNPDYKLHVTVIIKGGGRNLTPITRGLVANLPAPRLGPSLRSAGRGICRRRAPISVALHFAPLSIDHDLLDNENSRRHQTVHCPSGVKGRESKARSPLM